MKKEKLGQKIKKLRNENGLTQSELAEKIDVSFQQIQKYEKGENRISVQRLISIAEAMNIPVDLFFAKETAEPYRTEEYTALRLTREETTLIKLFRKIHSKKMKDSIILHLKGIIEIESEKNK